MARALCIPRGDGRLLASSHPLLIERGSQPTTLALPCRTSLVHLLRSRIPLCLSPPVLLSPRSELKKGPPPFSSFVAGSVVAPQPWPVTERPLGVEATSHATCRPIRSSTVGARHDRTRSTLRPVASIERAACVSKLELPRCVPRVWRSFVVSFGHEESMCTRVSVSSGTIRNWSLHRSYRTIGYRPVNLSTFTSESRKR